MNKQIGVIGLGHWGTALAEYLSRLGHEVVGWSQNVETVISIQQRKKNPTCFTDFPLSFSPTNDLSEALCRNVVVVALPSKVIGLIPALLDLEATQTIVSAMKGFESNSMKTPLSWLQENGSKAKHCVLSGPSFAIDVISSTPVALTAASQNEDVAKEVATLFASQAMRVYPSNDQIGVEIGGALKNVIAIASGISAGLRMGESTRAALITRGLAEMTRFSGFFGGKASTMMGLSGLGDLVLTTSSTTSRNYRLGLKLGEGKTIEAAQTEVGSTAEGLFSTPIVHKIAQQNRISMPITDALHKVLFDKMKPEEMVRQLMARPIVEENL